MHTINHAAVGSIIALVMKQPVVALPVALASHFMLDALPHYGVAGDEGYSTLFKSRRTVIMVLMDIVGIVILMLLLAGQAWYVFAAAFLATSPDFMWVYRYFGFERVDKIPPNWKIVRFHQKNSVVREAMGDICGNTRSSRILSRNYGNRQMRAVNHGLTGAAIAVLVKQPILALPLAYASHFVCDMIPHSGDPKEVIGSRKFWRILVADMALAIATTLTIAWAWPQLWWLVILCAFTAASPDLTWLYYKVLNPTKKLDPLTKWHHDIQWYQKPPGYIIEAFWFVIFFSILMYNGIK